MQIKLNLVLSVIKEAVKAETYIKGSIDRAAGNDQQASNAVAYQETAGDEEVHERKIMRGIYTASDKLRSLIVDYLNETNSTYGDNTVITINENTDSIVFLLELSSRFRKPNSNSLARLCSKYIEDQTLVWWWGTIGNQAQIQFYQAMLLEDATAIQKMFVKTSPSAVAVPYTTSVTLSGLTSNAEIGLLVGEEETITYVIDDDVIDDITAIADNGKVELTRYGTGEFTIKGVSSGISHVTFYSTHDESVYASLTVVVSNADSNGNNPYYSAEDNGSYFGMYPRY